MKVNVISSGNYTWPWKDGLIPFGKKKISLWLVLAECSRFYSRNAIFEILYFKEKHATVPGNCLGIQKGARFLVIFFLLIFTNLSVLLLYWQETWLVPPPKKTILFPHNYMCEVHTVEMLYSYLLWYCTKRIEKADTLAAPTFLDWS